MDLSKSFEYFDPTAINDRCHIIGCGSVGSTIAENLARLGVKDFVLYDFDIVEPHNIANQMFVNSDIKKLKVEATKRIIVDINPDAADDIVLEPKGWNGKMLSGYIFLCVDNIELRRKIVEQHMHSPSVKVMFDIRTLLESGQHYAADWSSAKDKKDFLAGMQFSHEEAAEETPVSACGVTLGVCTTVRLICGLAVNNFINYVREGRLWKMVNFMSSHGLLECF